MNKNERKVKRQKTPKKYANIIKNLKPGIYTAASIARFALHNNLINEYLNDGVPLEKAYTRIRISLGIFKNRPEFPIEGDGEVVITNQVPVPGWHHWRWQKVYLGDSITIAILEGE